MRKLFRETTDYLSPNDDGLRVNRAEEPTADAARSASPRPKIICLCGSTKFIDLFAVYTWELELQGYIVLGCTLLPSWYCPVRDHFAENQGVKPQRDAHHLQKIDLADEVLVLNVGGYIGESTRNEIDYARRQGKKTHFLEGEIAPTLKVRPVSSVRLDAHLEDGHLAGSPDTLATIESLQSELATLRSTHATLHSALRQETERCAQIAESYYKAGDVDPVDAKIGIAEAIRGRAPLPKTE